MAPPSIFLVVSLCHQFLLLEGVNVAFKENSAAFSFVRKFLIVKFMEAFYLLRKLQNQDRKFCHSFKPFGHVWRVGRSQVRRPEHVL